MNEPMTLNISDSDLSNTKVNFGPGAYYSRGGWRNCDGFLVQQYGSNGIAIKPFVLKEVLGDDYKLAKGGIIVNFEDVDDLIQELQEIRNDYYENFAKGFVTPNGWREVLDNEDLDKRHDILIQSSFVGIVTFSHRPPVPVEDISCREYVEKTEKQKEDEELETVLGGWRNCPFEAWALL